MAGKRLIKGEYIDDVEFTHNGEMVRLNVWRNPETGKFFALENMEVDASKNYAVDPHSDGDVAIVFENTFSGLPK